MANYDQNLSDWNFSTVYPKALLSVSLQKQYTADYRRHYDGDLSPWSKSFIDTLINPASGAKIDAIEQWFLDTYANNDNKEPNQINYGPNYRPIKIVGVIALLTICPI